MLSSGGSVTTLAATVEKLEMSISQRVLGTVMGDTFPNHNNNS